MVTSMGRTQRDAERREDRATQFGQGLLLGVILLVSTFSQLQGQATGTLNPEAIRAPSPESIESTIRRTLAGRSMLAGLRDEGLEPAILDAVEAAVQAEVAGFPGWATRPFELADESMLLSSARERHTELREALSLEALDMDPLARAGLEVDVERAVIEIATLAALEAARAIYDSVVATRRRLAVLQVDPAIDRSGRPSNWSFAFTADRGEKEAKLQMNLCDIWCPKSSAVAITLVGPVDAGAAPTALLDFDGLVGKSRLEVDVSVGEKADSAGGLWSAIEGRLAPTSFTYADSSTYASQKVQADLWSVGVSAGYRLGTDALFQIGYERQHTRKPGESQELCVPISSEVAGATTCRTTPIGPPAEVDQHLLALQVAARIGESAAARVEARRNSSSGDWFLDVPLYVVPDAAGELAGGVRFTHDFGEDETSVSLFVSLFKL